MPASGWIWMKDVAVAIAEQPISPVNELDDRPALVDLFTEYRTLIDKVATELATDPLYDASKHDDLWIVRFLLSHKKNVKASVKAAKHTLMVRAKHKLDEKDLRFSPVGPDVPDEAFRRYLKYCADDVLQPTIPDPKLGVVFYINAGHFDHNVLVKNVDEADWLPSFLYCSEWSHQWVDYISRTTGRLTASIRIMDLKGLSFKSLSFEGQKRDGKAMKVSEDCYPQMLKSIFVCRGPSWVINVWRLVRPVFPKRVVEKMDFLAPDKNEKERDRMLKYISMENLPTRFGGKYSTWPVNYPLPSKLG
jgi:CRAL/TRIO domain